MNSPTCNNCNYWGDSYDADENGNKDCDFTNTISGDTANKNGTGFTLQITCLDDQGLDVDIFTGPDFGCVHFLQKF